MKIGKKYKVGGHIVEVRQVEKLDSDGEFDAHKNVIYLDKSLSQSQKEETLLHEIMGYQNPSFHADNHGLLQAIAHSIYSFLKDNSLLK
jgi:hypothetical protein